MVRTLYNLLIPILIAAMGMFLGSWLLLQYSQAQLVMYTDGYYQNMDEVAIGEFYIVNEGREVDENVTVAINKEIEKDELTINYTRSNWNVETKDGLTYINFEQINPAEGIEVLFKLAAGDASFKVEDFTSKSGNTYIRPWIEPWWYFTRLQLALIFFFLTIAFGFGFVIGLWKNDVLRIR